jgi:hypothetical protein
MFNAAMHAQQHLLFANGALTRAQAAVEAGVETAGIAAIGFSVAGASPR